jgi:hypothetical protein
MSAKGWTRGRLRSHSHQTDVQENLLRVKAVVSVLKLTKTPAGPRAPLRGGARGDALERAAKAKARIHLARAGIPPPLSAGEAPSTDPELPPSGETPGDRNERFE